MNKLKSLEQALGDDKANKSNSHPPVHLWQPEHIGEIDITIRRDGSWLHEGSPIQRKSLVKLFSSVLWKENDKHFLKTPAEKLEINVELAPFLMIDLDIANPGKDTQNITLRSNYDDLITLGEKHPLVLDNDLLDSQSIPTVNVRYGMIGSLTQSLFFELVDHGVMLSSEGEDILRLRSGGADIDLTIQ